MVKYINYEEKRLNFSFIYEWIAMERVLTGSIFPKQDFQPPASLHLTDPGVYQSDFAHKLTRHTGVIGGRVNQIPTCSLASLAQQHKWR